MRTTMTALSVLALTGALAGCAGTTSPTPEPPVPTTSPAPTTVAPAPPEPAPTPTPEPTYSGVTVDADSWGELPIEDAVQLVGGAWIPRAVYEESLSDPYVLELDEGRVTKVLPQDDWPAYAQEALDRQATDLVEARDAEGLRTFALSAVANLDRRAVVIHPDLGGGDGWVVNGGSVPRELPDLYPSQDTAVVAAEGYVDQQGDSASWVIIVADA